MAYDTGNLPALMELLYGKSREGEQESIIITASLTNLARERGITEDEICKALFRTHEGPVFYYP